MYLEDKALPEVPAKVLKPWQELCLKAADYIEEHGWCQGNYSMGARVCLLGALNMAAGAKDAACFPKSTSEAIGHIAVKLGSDRACYVTPCHMWNDCPERRMHQVVDLLRSMAK